RWARQAPPTRRTPRHSSSPCSSPAGAKHTRLVARDGARAIELGEAWGCARIELDSRSERNGERDGRQRELRDPRYVDRRSVARKRAVDRVIRDALLGGMADGGNALAAELRLDQVALNVRQRVQLRRLLGEYQREGYEQVSQSTVHVTAEPGHS